MLRECQGWVGHGNWLAQGWRERGLTGRKWSGGEAPISINNLAFHLSNPPPYHLPSGDLVRVELYRATWHVKKSLKISRSLPPLTELLELLTSLEFTPRRALSVACSQWDKGLYPIITSWPRLWSGKTKIIRDERATLPIHRPNEQHLGLGEGREAPLEVCSSTVQSQRGHAGVPQGCRGTAEPHRGTRTPASATFQKWRENYYTSLPTMQREHLDLTMSTNDISILEAQLGLLHCTLT